MFILRKQGGVLEGNGHPQLQRVQGQPGLHKIVSQNTINERLESASMVNSQAVPEDQVSFPAPRFTAISKSSSRETETSNGL